MTQSVVHTHGVPFKSRKACDGKQCNSLIFVNLARKRRIIANKNELVVDYYSAYNPKTTGFFAPGTTLGEGGVFHCKSRFIHSRELKLSWMITSIMF